MIRMPGTISVSGFLVLFKHNNYYKIVAFLDNNFTISMSMLI